MNTYSNENFTLLIVGTFELYTRKVFEMFANKHRETIEYISLLFMKNTNFLRIQLESFLRSRMRNFQSSIFI